MTAGATSTMQGRLIYWGIGALEALLLARLLARLLAARPENLAIVLLYRLSDPLVAPLAGLDSGQPRFGAILELSTLLLLLVLLVVGYALWCITHRRQL